MEERGRQRPRGGKAVGSREQGGLHPFTPLSHEPSLVRASPLFHVPAASASLLVLRSVSPTVETYRKGRTSHTVVVQPRTAPGGGREAAD